MKTKEVFKRVCETEWHEEIELDKFERCPKCNSEAYHKVIVMKNDTTNPAMADKS